MNENRLVQTHKIAIEHSDKQRNELFVAQTNGVADKIFFICPAMGVRATYYHLFCEKLTSLNAHAAVMDWRGLGTSSARASRSQDWGFELVMQDVLQAITIMKDKFEIKEVVLVGHSLGGQIGSLLAARYPEQIDRLIGIGASCPYWKSWIPSRKLGLWAVGHIVNPLNSLLGYFPGNTLKFAGKESMTMMRDWSYAVRNGRYVLSNDQFDYEKAMQESQSKVHFIALKKDLLAPVKSVVYLKNKFKSAKINELVVLDRDEENGIYLDHFNWVKNDTLIIQYFKNTCI